MYTNLPLHPKRSYGYITVPRKRNGGLIHSTQAKFPSNSNDKCIYAANHPMTGVEPKPNCQLFQSSNNSLPCIFSEIKSNMCMFQGRRRIIFIRDFNLDFSVPVELVLSLLKEMVQYKESHGHLITFAHVPYVPAYSRDPRTKPSFSPQPDHTNYLITINYQLKAFSLLNTLKTCFSN